MLPERSTEGNAQTLDDIRRDVRLGMGPCQGGFCAYRATGILHQLRQPAVENTNLMLRDFLQERWKGLLPVLWGQQLRQERLDELIYLSILNADHLPGPHSSQLSPLTNTQPPYQADHARCPCQTKHAEQTAPRPTHSRPALRLTCS